MLAKQANKIFTYLENQQIPLIHYFLTFFFAINLRDFLESFSQENMNYLNFVSNTLGEGLLHTKLSYCVLASGFILLLHYTTKISVKTAIKLIFPLFIVLLLTPIIDMLVYGTHGHTITYFDSSKDLAKKYFLLGGDYTGISIGMKIETLFVLFSFFCFFLSRKITFLFSVLYTFFAYTLIFIYGYSPLISTYLVQHLGLKYAFPSYQIQLTNYFALLFFGLGIWISYLANKKIAVTLVKEFSGLRLLQYELMFVFGLSLGLLRMPAAISIQLQNYTLTVSCLFSFISIFFALLFSLVFNNIADKKIDAISNPNRALISGGIDLQTYSTIGFCAGIAAISYAALAGIKTFFLISVFMGIYYLYSMPPLRFKRVLVLSKLAISGNSLILVILGFLLTTHVLDAFPPILTAIFLIGFTLAANFIDIKDTQGDAADGIKTLPLVLGNTGAKIIIGLAFVATYLSFYFFFKNAYMLPLLGALGICQFYLINKKNIKNGKLF